MIAIIAKKEARDLVRDGRVRVLSGAVLVIAAVALVSGVEKQAAFAREQRAAEDRSRAQWEGQGDRNPHSAAHFGMYVNATHDVLALVDPGLVPFVGRSVWIEAHNQNPTKFRPIEDAPALARFGDLTLTFVLQQLVPLFLVLLAYTAFAGERDRGTLRGLFAVNVPPRSLLLGKLLGTVCAAALVLVPVAGAASVVILSAAADKLATAVRLVMLGLTYAAYYAVVLLSVLAVSARAHSTRAALSFCLAVWTVATLLVPRLAADLADRAHAPPSAADFWAAIDAQLGSAHTHGERRRVLEQQTLAQYGVTRLEDLPVNFDGIALQDGEEHANAVFDAHYGALFDTYEAQARFLAATTLVSPIMAVRAISSGLAGTDVAHHRAFVEAAEAYRRHVQRTMNDYLAYHSRTGQSDFRAGNDVWRELPAFAYTPIALGQTSRRLTPLAISLCAWVAVAMVFASVSLKRLSPL